MIFFAYPAFSLSAIRPLRMCYHVAHPAGSGSVKGSRWVLVACTLTMVLLVLDSSIVGVMLPSIQKGLAVSASGVAWVVSGYLLTLAVLLPVGGRVADAIGPVTAFIIGMGGFVVASTGIAFAPDEGWLIGWRAVAGGAAALLMPATMSLILGAFDQNSRARAFAVYAGVGQAFATVGPAVGGICAQFVGWQWGFLINIPVGVTGILLISIIRPANPTTHVTRWDVLGLGMLIIGLTSIVLALIQLPTWGAVPTLVLLLLGAGTMTLFIRRSLQHGSPLLSLRLFSDQTFAGGTIILACLGFGMTVATIYGAITLQNTLHLTPTASGLALLPLVIPLLAATRWVATRYNQIGARRLGITGTAAMIIGLTLIAAGAYLSSIWVICIGLAPVGIGIGLLLSPMNTASLTHVPDDQRGQASGIISTARQLGSVIGVAAFTLTTTLIPAGPHENGVVTGFTLTALILATALITATTMLPTTQPTTA